MKKVIYCITFLLGLLCAQSVSAYDADKEEKWVWGDEIKYHGYSTYVDCTVGSKTIQVFTSCSQEPVPDDEAREKWKKTRDKAISKFLETTDEYKNVGIYVVIDPDGSVAHVEPVDRDQKENPDEHTRLAMRLLEKYPDFEPAYIRDYKVDENGDYMYNEDGDIIEKITPVYFIKMMRIMIYPDPQ